MNPCKMYIYQSILIGASVLSISCAESGSNHALSSQSYDRGDVSLSNKYNLIHIYTTYKPQNSANHNIHQKNQNQGDPQKLAQLKKYQNIQYAPLPLNIQEQRAIQVVPKDVQKPEVHTEATTYDSENNETVSVGKKSNLVPRLAPKEPSNTRPRKYVPGYNVDLQAVNNKLLQNGLYASNPNFLVKNKQINVNYLQPQASFHKQNDLQVVSHNNDAKIKGEYSVLTYQYPLDKKSYGNIPSRDRDIGKRPFFHVKATKMQLNIAHAPHIARAKPKASVSVNSSFRKLPSLPQEFFSNSQILQPPKTQLYPVVNNNVYMTHRNS